MLTVYMDELVYILQTNMNISVPLPLISAAKDVAQHLAVFTQRAGPI